MQKENTRRLIRNFAVVGGIVLAVIVVFLIIRFAVTSMNGSGNPSAQTEVTEPLLNTSDDRGVKMTVRGPIVASENARSYEVDVTPTSRAVTLFGGYDGSVINKQVYANSPSAYEQFVYALNLAGMTNSRNANNTDTRGVCSLGNLTTFSLERDTTIESSLWTSSCSGSKGTLAGKAATLQTLFDAQIPDISKFRAGL